VNNTQGLDRAWAAGLYEGEGSFHFAGVVPTIKLAMCDREIVERFAKVIGRGQIYHPKKGKDHWNEVYWWQASGTQVEEIIGFLWPYLGTRRRGQIMNALHEYDVYLGKQQVERTRTCERCSGVFLTGYNKKAARWCKRCWSSASSWERKARKEVLV